MTLTQPEPIIWENFSPTIMQLEVSEKFVSVVNELGDAVLSDDVLSAKFDFSHGLVGKVSKEVKIPAYDPDDTKYLSDVIKNGCLQYLNYALEKGRAYGWYKLGIDSDPTISNIRLDQSWILSQ